MKTYKPCHDKILFWVYAESNDTDQTVNLFVLRFYGPVNPMGHVEPGHFT